MAEAGDVDSKCIKVFQKYVVKEHAGSANLSENDKNFGKNTTVRKILKEVLGEGDMVTSCEASIYPKYQEPKTKKMSASNFVKKVLPDLAAAKAKAKKGGDAATILSNWKEKMAKNLDEKEAKAKNAAVVDRLTDTSGYTGSHKERFDASGKGKGKEGREDIVENKGYVGAYKGEGTFDKK